MVSYQTFPKSLKKLTERSECIYAQLYTKKKNKSSPQDDIYDLQAFQYQTLLASTAESHKMV